MSTFSRDDALKLGAEGRKAVGSFNAKLRAIEDPGRVRHIITRLGIRIERAEARRNGEAQLHLRRLKHSCALQRLREVAS